MFNGALTPKNNPPVSKPSPPKKEVHVKTVDSLGGYNDKYLRKENLLGEYLSDSEKAIVRDNLGINVGEIVEYVKSIAEQEVIGGCPTVQEEWIFNNRNGIMSLLKSSTTGTVMIYDNNKMYSADLSFEDEDHVDVTYTKEKDGSRITYIVHVTGLSNPTYDYIEYK